MDAVSSTALSGLQAAQARLDSSANNIANAETPGYRRERVEQTERQDGGVQARTEKLPEPGRDLAADVVEQQQAARAFEANVQVLRRADEVLGRLLDTKA